MNLPRLLIAAFALLFGGIFVLSVFKKDGKDDDVLITRIDIDTVLEEVQDSPVEQVMGESLPDADRIDEFFSLTEPKFPVVETITYSSRVPWKKGRAAWVSDYASHYKTSRHFIARSLNRGPDYFSQEVRNGDRFNVFKPGKDLEFYLLVDLSLAKMWLHYVDMDTREKVLVKSYAVGLGREDESRASGYLTPVGKYRLGDRIAIFKPKVYGKHEGERVELVTVFGTRWIPFESEIEGCSEPAKGFGIHGCPWNEGQEDSSGIGKYTSDGCIRMRTADMEELFALIITKPTTIDLVKDHRVKEG